MTSEWNNQVLSLIETAPDFFILTSRKLYSVGMGWFLIDLELEWDWNDEMTLKWMEWSYFEENMKMEWRNVAELESFQN